jgi:Tol biopolymer transport system component
VSYDQTLSIGAFSASTEGVIAYRPGGAGKRQLTWFDRKGAPLGTMGPIDDSLVAPTLSPDGRRVALHRTVRSNTDVWIFDSIRSTQLTFDPGLDRFPIWSPDGEEVFFDSTRKGGRKLYRVRTGAAGTEVPVEVPGNDQAALHSSSDGRYLLYTVTGATTGRDIWILPLKGNERPYAYLHESYDERSGQFSPDGRWIAYLSNASGQYNVEVRPFPGPGGHWQVSASGGVQPRWSHDGKEIYYISPDSKLMAVPITVKGDSLEPGAPAVLFSTRIWGGASCCTLQQYDVARDGRFLINVASDDAAGSPITLLLNWKPTGK